MEIRRSQNPLTLAEDYQFLANCDGLTPNQFIEQENIIFTRPVILLIDGEPVMRADWDTVFASDAICHFVELPRGGGDSNPLALLATLAIIVLALYAAPIVATAMGVESVAGLTAIQMSIAAVGTTLVSMFLAPDIPHGADTSVPENVYSFTSGHNTLKLGRPYPEHFGRFINFPCLAQQPHTDFWGNNHCYYMLGIIGIGQYDIEGVFLGRTPVSDLDMAYNILPPGTAPTLVPRIVWVCESGGQELTTDWFTTVVSAAGTKATEISFDIILPSGLVSYSSSGNRRSASVCFQANVRKIDNEGVALSEWKKIVYRTITGDSPTARRRTYDRAVTAGAGRYEFQIKRLSEKSTDAKLIDTISIGGIRAIGPFYSDLDGYDNVTMIEAKVEAAQQLNGNTINKLNVVATRKLYPVTETGFGTELVATRSIVDACAYIVTSENGANLPDSILNFPALASMRTTLENRSNFFDHRFTTKTTIMSACTLVAKCGRAVPYMPGGLFALVRDENKALPSQIYTEDDYTKNSLILNHIVRTDESPTCVEMEYIDENTWQNKKVTCVGLGGSLDNPAVVKLVGCTSRQHAYEEGMYRYWEDEYNRSVVQFTTGLKGHIPSMGDMIVVAVRMSDWGQSGQIAYIDGTDIWLTEPVDFKDEAEGQIYLTTPSGDTIGPYLAQGTDHSHCISIAVGVTNTLHTDMEKASKFVFGPLATDFLRVRLLGVKPLSENEVRVEGTLVHDEVYADPGLAAEDVVFPPPIILNMLTLDYRGSSGGVFEYYASWEDVPDFAYDVELDEGSGYVTIQGYYTECSLVFTTTASAISVRVTPWSGYVLDTERAAVRGGCALAPVQNLRRINTTDIENINLEWDAVTGADSYEVCIAGEWDGAAVEASEMVAAPLVISQHSYLSFYNQMSFCTGIVFSVRAIAGDIAGEYSADLNFIPGAPDAVTGAAVVSNTFFNTIILTWDDIDWESQFGFQSSNSSAQGYVICRGEVSDFDPVTANIETAVIGAFPATVSFSLPTPSETAYIYYFKVAAFTSGCNELTTLNFSDCVVAASTICWLTEESSYLAAENFNCLGE